MRNEQGQATLELAFCLPILVVLLGIVVEVGLLAGDKVRVEHAAREAARAAAVESAIEPVEAAADAGGLDGLRVEISPPSDSRVQGQPVTVMVSYSPPGHVPFVGALFNGDLSASAQMRIERP